MEKHSTEEIASILREYRPYILDLERIVSETKYGTVTLELQVHDGFVTNLVSHIAVRKRYEQKSPSRRAV